MKQLKVKVINALFVAALLTSLASCNDSKKSKSSVSLKDQTEREANNQSNQSSDKTLTEEEIKAAYDEVNKELSDLLGIEVKAEPKYSELEDVLEIKDLIITAHRNGELVLKAGKFDVKKISISNHNYLGYDEVNLNGGGWRSNPAEEIESLLSIPTLAEAEEKFNTEATQKLGIDASVSLNVTNLESAYEILERLVKLKENSLLTLDYVNFSLEEIHFSNHNKLYANSISLDASSRSSIDEAYSYFIIAPKKRDNWIANTREDLRNALGIEDITITSFIDIEKADQLVQLILEENQKMPIQLNHGQINIKTINLSFLNNLYKDEVSLDVSTDTDLQETLSFLINEPKETATKSNNLSETLSAVLGVKVEVDAAYVSQEKARELAHLLMKAYNIDKSFRFSPQAKEKLVIRFANHTSTSNYSFMKDILLDASEDSNPEEMLEFFLTEVKKM